MPAIRCERMATQKARYRKQMNSRWATPATIRPASKTESPVAETSAEVTSSIPG